MEENDDLKQTVSNLRSENTRLLDEIMDIKREYERKIEVLQDKLENVAIKASQRPTQTTNTYNNRTQINNLIQKMEVITDEHLRNNPNT